MPSASPEVSGLPESPRDAAAVTAVLIRVVEERLLALYGEGHLHGTVHTCVGQEWTGVALAQALQPGDHIVSNHRGHGHYLAWTDDVEGLIAEIMGKATGPCLGRGGSQHLYRDGFLSNGIIGGMAPVAAGLAMAHKLAGDGRIVALMVGDGGLAQGVLFEALNFASAFALPLFVVVEANGVAQSTAVASVQAGSATARAAAFGIEARLADTWNTDGLLTSMEEAAAAIRCGSRPMMQVIETFRLMPHSKGDDFRPADLIAEYRRRDPVTRWIADGGAEAAAAQAEAVARVEAAVSVALVAPAAQPAVVRSPCRAEPVSLLPVPERSGRMVDRIRKGLEAAMAADDTVVLLGEDICSPYGGAFKATTGLSDRYPGRVFNSPISEAGLVGLGTGLAMGGRRPVVEIMFGDFLTLACDQLVNHASKFSAMYGDQVTVPLVVRTPMGGRRGYGPTHSQSLEARFLGIPGLSVVAVHHRMDAEALYARLCTTASSPHLVIENKVAYGKDGFADRVEGFDYLETDEDLPTLILRPPVPATLTLFGYGGMLIEMEKAVDLLFERHDIVAEVICPTALYPVNLQPLVDSVARTRHLLIVEEGQGFAGFGSEAAAFLQEALNGAFRLKRLAAAPTVISCAREGEDACLVSAEDIVKAAGGMCRG
jgi:2-oxoisovalerate dehydrogenase E1 component